MDTNKLFELTPKQQKCFIALKKAIEDCKKANMLFYNCYGTLGFCDKNKIEKYDDTPSELTHYENAHNPYEINLPCQEWSDDTHYFHPKN